MWGEWLLDGIGVSQEPAQSSLSDEMFHSMHCAVASEWSDFLEDSSTSFLSITQANTNMRGDLSLCTERQFPQ